jgi:hypothetical protein
MHDPNAERERVPIIVKHIPAPTDDPAPNVNELESELSADVDADQRHGI